MGTAALHQHVGLLETPLVGPQGRVAVPAHVPLACDVGMVAATTEYVGDGRHPVGEVGFIARLPADRRRELPGHGTVTGRVAVRAREQHGSGRRAHHVHPEMGHEHAPFRESVDIGRAYLAAHHADVRIAHVVGQDDQKVGALGPLRGTGGQQARGAQRQQACCQPERQGKGVTAPHESAQTVACMRGSFLFA